MSKENPCVRKAIEKMALIVWTVYYVFLLSVSSALSIQQCSPGPKYVYEHTLVQLTCGQCSDKIQWYVRGDNDQHEKYVGECVKTVCNVEDKNAFRLSAHLRNELYSSVLDIINISQPEPLHVWCKCYRNDRRFYFNKYHLEDSALCKLITVPISIVPASFGVELLGWKVSGVCTIQWLDGQTTPTCKWSMRDKNGARELTDVQSQTISVRQRSVLYWRRNCTFEVDMPVDDGDYTYSLTVPSHPADRFSKTFNIEQPEVPKHNCPEMVLEGSSINCTCYTSKIGNPPAHIAWSESNNEQLVVENVSRKRSSTLAVCHLLWGAISKQTVYTVTVMHGPSGINISSYTRTSGDSTEIVLVCSAIDVYPLAVFLWNISCDNRTDNTNTSTCTFTTANKEAEIIVECTASNGVFENVSLSAIHIVHISQNKQSHDAITIIGIAAAVVIFFVTGSLIFVYMVKQRLERRPRKKVFSKCRTQTPIVRYAAPSGDLYTIAGTTIKDQGDNENITFRETIVNRLCTIKNIVYHQASSQLHETNETRKRSKLTINPKQTKTETIYVNATELSADYGLDLYHRIPRATMFGSDEPDTSKAAVVADGEYNNLHFQVHRSGHEHHDTYYSHLNLE